MGPPGHDRTSTARGRASGILSPRNLSYAKLDEVEQQLFYLVYEKKPPHSGCDYRYVIPEFSFKVYIFTVFVG